MKDKYITVTGINHYYGIRPFKIGKKLRCVKESDNCYDSEAIRVERKCIGKIGYVANSPYTVATGCLSAGGIRSKVKKKFYVEVCFIDGGGVICKVVDGWKEKKGTVKKVDQIEEDAVEAEH